MTGTYYKVDKDKEEEFTERYNRCFDYVYSFIYARTAGDERVTEEIVQDTFASAWISQGSFSERSSYSTWVCGIAKNKLHEYYRKRTATEKHEVMDNEMMEELSSGLDLEGIVLDAEESKSINDALNNINHLYRYCLILKYLDDYSVKEIAHILGRTPKAVDGILQRAKVCFIREYLRLAGKGNVNG
jgi:RNA polymerase sigma-70 factor (ECF subfamily)